MDSDDSNALCCLICGEYVTDGVSISEEQEKATDKGLLDGLIAQILAQHDPELILQSDNVCKLCYEIYKSTHEMEKKLQEQRQKLKTRFTKKEHMSGPKQILLIPPDDEVEVEIMQSEVVPQQIHLIEAGEADEKKLTTFEEIEQQLGKLHGESAQAVSIEIMDKIPSGGIPQATTEFVQPEKHNVSKPIKKEIKDEMPAKRKRAAKTKSQVKRQAEMKTEYSADQIIARHDSIYTCLLCISENTVCGEAKGIMAHVKSEHDMRVYVCDYCGDIFRKRNELSAHMDFHVENDDGDFQCEVCNRIFNNLRLFRIHKRMHYPSNKSWACDRCGKKYSSKNLLDEHMNTHTGVRPYWCTVCGKDFASKYTYKAHLKTHQSRARPHACSKCPKAFLNVHNLMQHERTHMGIKDYACHLCGKKFGSAHNLEVHSIVHTNYRPFICGLCGKSFARKGEIRDHERIHTGERPFQCEMCGATFSQRSNLQSHKRATHFDDKRYTCPTCNRAFKRRRLLEYHIKAVHTGERPFKCSQCEATFIYPEHFKKHRRIHTGEKPFTCEVCQKAFNSRDNRNAHRFVHSDKKPYECMDCGAGFMRKPLLYAHMQTDGHMNDTIIINQPRLPDEDSMQLVQLNADGRLDIEQRKVSRLQSDLEDLHAKQAEDAMDDDVFLTESIMLKHEAKSGGAGNTFMLANSSDTIIIDGEQFQFKGEIDEGAEGVEENEEGQEDEELEAEEILGTTEDLSSILTPEAIAGAKTQFLHTKEGTIQLVAVRIPNENGEEEEAWLKILPNGHVSQ